MTDTGLRAERTRLQAEDDAVEVFATERFEIALVSARDPLKDVNEDAAFAADLGEHGAVLVAIDGMGGMKNGREAARVALDEIATCVRRWHPDGSLRAALVEGLEAAHEAVLAACSGGGATVAAALVRGDQMQTIHAGDAEALVFGQKGKIKHRTPPHSPVGYAVQAGLVDEDDAHEHPERHFVSNGLGLERMTIELGPRLELSRYDTIVVASDGLTDNVTTSEIVEVLRTGTLVDSCEELLGRCRARIDAALLPREPSLPPGKPDDITFIALRRNG